MFPAFRDRINEDKLLHAEQKVKLWGQMAMSAASVTALGRTPSFMAASEFLVDVAVREAGPYTICCDVYV